MIHEGFEDDLESYSTLPEGLQPIGDTYEERGAWTSPRPVEGHFLHSAPVEVDLASEDPEEVLAHVAKVVERALSA